ncbi:MAG: ATP-binding protein [Streptosporangiaceae bacterium]
MTRRILLVLVVFTAVLITGAMVPLALNTTAHDRNAFLQEVEGMARTDAAVARTRLESVAQSGSKAKAYAPLVTVLNEAQLNGDRLMILQSRRTVSSAGLLQVQESVLIQKGSMPVGNWSQLARQADNQSGSSAQARNSVQSAPETTGSWVVVATPVYSSAGVLVGTVILARSSASLNRAIVALWAILATIGVVGLIGATLLAFALVRWVSRPLARLDGAAGRLADGDLTSRAVVDSGPPELRRMATTFNTMAGRLEALVHGNRAVIADVSHQLRTPLAALRLRLDLLAADTAQSDPDTAHELAGALDELARLSRLVDGLLAVARAENVVPVPVAVDVAAVARERVAAWRPVADDRDIGLTATPPWTEPVPAWIGEGHLEQVLDNLIANALEALSAGGHITVTAKVTTAGARITVADDGPGMDAADRERAFLRFSTSNPNGTGLGLAIVHRLVTSNGGTARLAETPGGGLTVILDFPSVPASTSTEAGSASAQDFVSI